MLGAVGGLHLTLQLPSSYNADQIAATARAADIDIRPLSTYVHSPLRQEPGLVMGYGRLPLHSVPAVIATLRRAIQSGPARSASVT